MLPHAPYLPSVLNFVVLTAEISFHDRYVAPLYIVESLQFLLNIAQKLEILINAVENVFLIL